METVTVELTKEEIYGLVRWVDFAEEKTEGKLLKPGGREARAKILAAIRPDDPTQTVA